MQFKVPQFLDIEDKMFGPFTFRQFVYLAGGAGLCYILYKVLGLFLGLVPIAAIAGFSLALTFYRPNNKPFMEMIVAGIKYFSQDRLYIWKKQMDEPKKKPVPVPKKAGSENVSLYGEGRLTKSKLRDLAWSLDVLDVGKKEEQNN